MEEELQLENKIQLQEEVDEVTVVDSSGTADGANYLNKGKQSQEIDLQLRTQER